MSPHDSQPPALLIASMLLLFVLANSVCSVLEAAPDKPKAESPPAASPVAASVLGEAAKPGPYAVGVRTIELVDTRRQDPYTGGHRTLVTEIWYPAIVADGAETNKFTDYFRGHEQAAREIVKRFQGELEEVNKRFVCTAVRDARRRAGRYPLLVFSHGNGGFRHQNTFQVEHLASHGYIVAAPDHSGNCGVTVLQDRYLPYNGEGRQRSRLDRPQDVKFVVDQLLRRSRERAEWLHDSVDVEAIGVLGHSFGGMTVCELLPNDARVKASLAMTLAVGPPPTIPVFVMVGGLDRTVGPFGNAASTQYYNTATGPRFFLSLREGGHYSFTEMAAINPNFGDGIGVEKSDKGEVHFTKPKNAKDVINAYSIAFFDRFLKGAKDSTALLDSNAFPELIDFRGGVDATASPDASAK